MESGKGTLEYKTISLKDLIKEAKKILDEGEVEYGVWFIGKLK